MTKSEQESVDRLYKLLSEIKADNDSFRSSAISRIERVESDVAKKHVPVIMEQEIMDSIDQSISKALSEAMTGYNSPLVKYAHNVVVKYQNQIESIFDQVVQEGISAPDFKDRVREVLLSKITKAMVSGIDGSVDKTINLMKQDATFRARLTLSVNGLVEEFLTTINSK